MTKRRIVVSLPNDNAYQHEQSVVARATGERLGIELQVVQAKDDAIIQSQQLLEMIQNSPETRPDGILVEPVTGTGLPRVADAAVAAGIAWGISNSDVDYVHKLRKIAKVPVFTVTQGQAEIGRIQARQMAALLPQGGSVLFVEGPSLSSVAVQRREGLETAKARNIQLTSLRSKWSEEGAYQSVQAWLKLATSRAEKFDLVAGQTHELAMGARKALQNVENAEQKKRWLEMPFIGIGVASQVRPLVDGKLLMAAVVTSVTTELGLQILVRTLESKMQPPERSVVDVASFPELERLAPKR